MLSERRPVVALAHTGVIHIFTFKQGALSRLAHDLRLSVPHFEIELRARRVRARFDVSSAHVDGVVVGDHVDLTKFSKYDTEVIERNMRDAVLKTERFPAVELVGEVEPAGAGWTVHARLTMVGRACDLDLPVVRAGMELFTEIHIKPSLWGIPPFTAMGGAIGIEDRWRVQAKLALDGHTPVQVLHSDQPTRWTG